MSENQLEVVVAVFEDEGATDDALAVLKEAERKRQIEIKVEAPREVNTSIGHRFFGLLNSAGSIRLRQFRLQYLSKGR